MEKCRSGYTFRNGKCSKRSGNPFKMWLPYVAAVVFGIIEYIQGYGISKGIVCDPNVRYFIQCIPGIGTSPSLNLLIITAFSISGFLLGYVLTILYRRVFR